MIRSLLLILTVLTNLSQAQDITLDTVLHHHLEAMGGQQSWQQIKTCYAEQSYWAIPIDMPPHRRFLGDQMSKNQTNYYQYPDQFRGNVYSEGELSTAIIVNHEEAKFYSYRSKHELVYPESDLERVKAIHAFTFSTYLLGPTPLLISAYEDSSVVYHGQMEAYGKLCHKLVITNGLPLGGKTLIYLDVETYWVHALVHEERIDRYKIYDDYQKVDGLFIPHNISSYHEGERYEEYTLYNIIVNQTLEASLFAKW